MAGKQEADQDVFVFGSADLLTKLMAEGLVDEHCLCLAPLVWGAGTPLFKPGSGRTHFAMRESQPFKNGRLILSYERMSM